MLFSCRSVVLGASALLLGPAFSLIIAGLGLPGHGLHMKKAFGFGTSNCEIRP